MLAFAGCVGIRAQWNFGDRGNKREKMKARRKPPEFWDTAQGSPLCPGHVSLVPGPRAAPRLRGACPRRLVRWVLRPPGPCVPSAGCLL